MKLNHPSISTEQGSQLVSLLPSAPKPLKSLRDNTIREVLNGYTYHPVEQILQILPKTRDTAKT